MARQILGKVVPTGEDTYDNSRTYDELCIVMYNGQSYISKKETRGNKPDNTEYWQQLVEKPVKGIDYFTEADKDEIVNDVTNDATNKYNQAVATGMETFNQNAERKTSDFNDNASEKTDTYNANADSTTQAFTNNANSKTEAYNTNATEKLDIYNSNHTAKLKEYNDNATSKLSAYNTNTVTKTTEYNSNHTNKMNTYDTNASNKVDTYNTNADTRLEEYNTNANNKINEYDEHSKELNNKIVSTRNELERLKSNVLNTGEDTDTFIHVEDSAMAEMQEIKVDGVCKQNTTTGKNLFCLPQSATLNGITFNVNSDGSFNISGTSTANATFLVNLSLENSKLKSGNTYTLSTNKELGDIAVNVENYSNTTWESAIFTLNKTLTKVTGAYNITDNTNIVRYSVMVASEKTVNLSNVKIQFEEGSAPTDFEPYTGGQSPSPDYPQEIKTITDSLKITSCWKNLFDIDKYPILSRTAYSDGKLMEWNEYTGIRSYFPLKENETYTLSNSLNVPIYYGLVFYDENKQVISYINKPTRTFTTPAKCRYIRFSFNMTEKITWVQIEQANTASEYEPYVESQIQAKLPENEFIGKIDDTYKDTLRAEYFPKEGQYHWMLDKKVGKHVFTGDEDFTIMNPSSGIAQIRYLNSKIAKLSDSNYVRAISNYFTHNYSWGNSWSKDNSVAHWVGFSAIVFYSSNFSTVSDFKQFLKDKYDNGNPVVVYYLLATPYTLDLGVIDMPLSYNEVTNIFTDSDLLPTINAKYYRVFDKTIQNAQINEKTLKQEITDLNATVSALDNRLKALETKTVEEPTESEGTV